MLIERLSKFLAHSGVASRRKADVIIQSGRVKVNGSVVLDPFHRVSPGVDTITLDGERLSEVSETALHSPLQTCGIPL